MQEILIETTPQGDNTLKRYVYKEDNGVFVKEEIRIFSSNETLLVNKVTKLVMDTISKYIDIPLGINVSMQKIDIYGDLSYDRTGQALSYIETNGATLTEMVAFTQENEDETVTKLINIVNAGGFTVFQEWRSYDSNTADVPSIARLSKKMIHSYPINEQTSGEWLLVLDENEAPTNQFETLIIGDDGGTLGA